MKKSELRTLLEWFYDDKYRDLRGETWLRSGGWRPNEDSNQLDLLEDKLKYKIINIVKNEESIDLNVKIRKFDCYYLLDDKDNLICGTGKTKNEARLDAILNYVQTLKVENKQE